MIYSSNQKFEAFLNELRNEGFSVKCLYSHKSQPDLGFEDIALFELIEDEKMWRGNSPATDTFFVQFSETGYQLWVESPSKFHGGNVDAIIKGTTIRNERKTDGPASTKTGDPD